MSICPSRPTKYININGRRYNIASWFDGFSYEEETKIVEYINSRNEICQINNVSNETYQQMAKAIEELYS